MSISINMLRETIKEGTEKSSAPVLSKAMIPATIATSIDTIAAGITFAILEVNIVIAILVIGGIAFLFAIVGVKTGNIFGHWLENWAYILYKIILIGIVIKIFITG